MSYQVNGNEPAIVGKICEGLYLVQHQENGSITDPSNVALFRFDDNWVKLYFDGGTIFWRESEAPSEPVNGNLLTCLSLLNLCELEGVVGHKLNSIEYNGDNKHVWATLQFTSGKTLLFKHNSYDDYTAIHC
ncbi:MAG: hypothetical protein AB2810_03525 [Candidatus Thiodiazotropha endolucinida]